MMNIPEKAMSEIARSYGTSKEALKYLGGGHEGSDGIVYQYDSKGKVKALKFMIIDAKDTGRFIRTMERLKFVNFLGENGVNIVYPQPSVKENLLEQYRVDNKIYLAYSMDKVDGKMINQLNPEEKEKFIEEWGRVIGQLHACSKKYPAWQNSDVNGETMPGWNEEWTFFEQWCKDEEVREAWKNIKNELNKLPVERDSFGFIHNDPHPYNLLIGEDKVTLLDFDVANYHWFMNDIGIAAYSGIAGNGGGFEKPQKDKGYAGYFIDKFMSGYEKENHLDSKWLDKIELFMSYRRILLFIVLYEGLLKDKSSFEHWKGRIVNNSPIMTF